MTNQPRRDMSENETFNNWLKERGGYAAAAQNLSEEDLYNRISKLSQYQHEGATGPDGYEVELRDDGTSTRFPASNRKDSLVMAFLFAVYKRWAGTPWDTVSE